MHRHTLNSKDFVAVRALPRIPGHGAHRNFMLRPPSRSTNRITVTFMVRFHNVFCRCPWDIRLSRPSTLCLRIADIVHTLAFPGRANSKTRVSAFAIYCKACGLSIKLRKVSCQQLISTRSPGLRARLSMVVWCSKSFGATHCQLLTAGIVR